MVVVPVMYSQVKGMLARLGFGAHHRRGDDDWLRE
jgi:hypothetical protein